MRFANGSIFAGVVIILESLIHPLAFSGSILVLYVILLFNLLIISRFSFQALRKWMALLSASGDRVLIAGADSLAEMAARYLTSIRIRIVGFVDDDNFKFGKMVHGRPVLGSFDDLDVILARTWFNQILIATEGLANDRTTALLDIAARHQIPIRLFSIGMREMATIQLGKATGSAVATLSSSPAMNRT
jgi:FlaA1/EpsC-like NDP-sugar epimerase